MSNLSSGILKIYMVIEIRNYAAEEHGDWIHENDLLIFAGTNVERYKRSAYDTLKGWVIYADDELAGSCLHDVDDDTTIRPYWYFAYLGIHPKYQHQGLGTKLLHRLLETADKNRANLECWAENTNYVAIHLYKTNDFTVYDSDDNWVILKRRPQMKSRKIENYKP